METDAPTAPATPVITGTTRLFAVLGDPVDQVQAPSLLNPLFARLGFDAVLVPVHARPEQLAQVVRGLQRIENLDGLLITVPHKVAMCQFADELSTAVAASGSTNAIRRNPDGSWRAENFDGIGFVRGLVNAGHTLAGRRAALVGGGGAGSAIAAALLDAGVSHLSLCDTDADKRAQLVDRLDQLWPGRTTGSPVPRLDDVDLAVNATPLGMRPDDPLPFAPGDLGPDCLVADIIMKPSETPLLLAAAAAGYRVHPGIHMLSQQLDLYREFFGIG